MGLKAFLPGKPLSKTYLLHWGWPMRSRTKSQTWTKSTRSLLRTSKTWWLPIPPVGLLHWHINRQSRRCRCSIILLQCRAQLSSLCIYIYIDVCVCKCDEHLLQGHEGPAGQAVCAMYSARRSDEQFALSCQDSFWFVLYLLERAFKING